MPRYYKVVEAKQWFKPGDHPAVEPGYDGCGRLGPYDVIPGDWIITDAPGSYRCEDEVFRKTYRPVQPPREDLRDLDYES